MNIEEIWRAQMATPLGAPAYPFGPYRFFDRDEGFYDDYPGPGKMPTPHGAKP